MQKLRSERSYSRIPSHGNEEKVVTGVEPVPKNRHEEDRENTNSSWNAIENDYPKPPQGLHIPIVG